MKINSFKIFFLITIVVTPLIIAQDTSAPKTPAGIKAISYELHAEIFWQQNSEPDLAGYKVYKANETGYEFTASVKRNRSFYWEWLNSTGVEKKYKISAYDLSGNESALSEEVVVKTHEMSDEEFLDMTQRAAFRYFWDWCDPNSGLARERWHPNESDVTNTIGGSGFGIMAILVGIERGFITREQGTQRIMKILDFLSNKAERFHGVFPHWLNGTTGKVVKFGIQDGGDIVETSFLIQGLLTARQYFNKQISDEEQIRAFVNYIWNEVDWEFYRNGSTGLFWNWSPTMGYNFKDTFIFHGWNETLITYILSLVAPEKPVTLPALSFYRSGWGDGDKIKFSRSVYDIPLFVGTNFGGPLFFTHYSFLGFDPRAKKDWYTNYFEHNKNQTLINRAYCIKNPKNFAGYGENCWGLTASYSIPGIDYSAHEPGNDNGTIAPTAALSAMPYTPTESISALKHFYRLYGSKLWGDFGFKDAFNPTKQWFSDGYLAIDQGPIVCMIENKRSQLLWNYFMSSPELKPLMDFSSGKGIFFIEDTEAEKEVAPEKFELIGNYPNPFNPVTKINYRLSASGHVSLKVFDLVGREVATLVDEYKPAGSYSSQFPQEFSNSGSISNLSSGIYLYTLKSGNYSQTRKMILLK